MSLADFGGDVVKVERPGTGDELRRRRLHGGDTSLLFRALGRNKRSATVDLRRPEGQEIVRALAARSDVLLENFRPGTLERWGLGPASCARSARGSSSSAFPGRPDRVTGEGSPASARVE